MGVIVFSVLPTTLSIFIITKSDLNQWVPFPLATRKSRLLVRNKNNYKLHYYNQRLIIHFFQPII